MNNAVFVLHPGTAPLLVSLPHAGTVIPDDLQPHYVPRALELEDTDWHLVQLYQFVLAMGASLIAPHNSRYVVDLNRPSENTPMYPGVNNTELCPTRFFTGDPLYLDGHAPDAPEITRRVATYWRPYHQALESELARLQALHGHVVLFDAHSIKSQLPWLFEGRLPDLNIGTVNGASADASITNAVAAACAGAPGVTSIVNGRFKGGYITRHYGKPAGYVHAVQLEMCQSTYMQEVAPYAYDGKLAQKIQPVIANMVGAALQACKALYAR